MLNNKFKRIIAISDVHGQCNKLLKLLDKTKYDSAYDKLVIMGDMIDRGNQNLSTIYACQKLQRRNAAEILKGNHEQMAIACIVDMIDDSYPTYPMEYIPTNNLDIWSCNGGKKTYKELKKLTRSQLISLLSFLNQLPLYFEIDNYIFVHAGVDPKKTIEKNTENDLVWCKDSFFDKPAYKGKTVIFGHTPTFYLYGHDKYIKNKKETIVWYDEVNKDKIGIDCGSVYGGKLAALVLPTMQAFYI